MMQHFEFGRSQRYAAPTASDFVRFAIQHEVTEAELSMREGLAPQPGAHPGKQLFDMERLDNVVVRAAVQASNPVRYGIARGDDDDRRFTDSADAATEREAIHARQHPIQDDQHRLDFFEQAESLQ